MSGPLARVLLILGLLTTVLGVGAVGFRVVEGAPWFDSFYMALTTLTTVGYDEIIPLSMRGRLFNSLLILSGVIVTFVAIGLLADVVIRLELADYFGRRRRIRMLTALSDHYIVCGAGRVGRVVVEELLRNGASVVLIDNDAGGIGVGVGVGCGEGVGAGSLPQETNTRSRAAATIERMLFVFI